MDTKLARYALHVSPLQSNGAQARYNVSARFTPASTAGHSTTSRAMGFRHVALVTLNDTDPAVVLAAKQNATTHTGAFTMLFRVNGAAILSRGGSKIPMDLMEGRMTANAHRRLVQSAAEGKFSMIRIWGGGIYEPRAFFDSCDEFVRAPDLIGIALDASKGTFVNRAS